MTPIDRDPDVRQEVLSHTHAHSANVGEETRDLSTPRDCKNPWQSKFSPYPAFLPMRLLLVANHLEIQSAIDSVSWGLRVVKVIMMPYMNTPTIGVKPMQTLFQTLFIQYGVFPILLRCCWHH